MEKRGQITIFIILGIVILVALIIVFSFRNYIFKERVDLEEREQVLGEAIKPVRSYLDSCIRDLTNNAVDRIGLQGGYINIPEDTKPINPLLPFSRNLDIFGNGVFKVPYWFYESDNNVKKIEVPNLKEIEKRIEDYIDTNINVCLDNVTFFEDYEISRFKNTRTNVVIGDNAVIVKIKTNLNINYKGLNQEINDFNFAIDYSLGKLYKIAKDIFDNQNNNLFFEDKTYDIISLYKDEIPISGIDLSCSVKTWNYQNIYNDFRTIMSANIPQFKVTGTKYSESDRFYLWRNVIRGNYNDVSVNFLYSENFPTYLDVNPRNGNILRSNNAASGNKNPLANLLCLQYYNFVYSLKYPILISLTDDKGFTFQYAIQVILKNNQPRENVYYNGYSDFSEKFCDNRVNDVSVAVVDEDDNFVNNVEIKYKCSAFICDIGNTDNGVLKDKFPICFNGFVIANKEGYSEEKKEFSTDVPGEITVKLSKLYNKPIRILANGFDLKNDEEAIITFNHLDKVYSFTIGYPESKNAELIDGDYNVSVTVFKKGNFVIKGEDKRQCIKVPRANVFGLLGFKREECVDVKLDDLELDNIIIGRSEFTMFAPLFDLKDNTNLVVDVDIFNAPVNYNDLEKTFSNLTFGTYTFER